MKSLPRCKFCKKRLIFALGVDGRNVPVDLGAPEPDILLTSHDGGWKATHPTNMEKLKAAGYITGRRHACPRPLSPGRNA